VAQIAKLASDGPLAALMRSFAMICVEAATIRAWD
jgi:hypothetical protein